MTRGEEIFGRLYRGAVYIGVAVLFASACYGAFLTLAGYGYMNGAVPQW